MKMLLLIIGSLTTILYSSDAFSQVDLFKENFVIIDDDFQGKEAYVSTSKNEYQTETVSEEIEELENKNQYESIPDEND